MKKPVISLIAAVGQNGEIGKNGDLIWRISEDLKRFKKITMGGVLIMGRKTYESVGRPLPGRINMVITSQKNYPSEGIFTVRSPGEALEKAACFGKPVFVIGGEKIFDFFLPHADIMYLTRINASDNQADAYFPDFDEKEWNVREKTPAAHTAEGIAYYYMMLERKMDTK